MKFTEIFKLKEMLEKAKIPFEFYDRSKGFPLPNYKVEHYQICYPVTDGDYRICSIIQGTGTYGGEEDLLEIMGLTGYDEEDGYYDDVEGYLSAAEVFDRIYEHWQEHKNDT